MSTRTLAAALAPGLLLALALYAGEAAAQNVCRGGSHTGSGIITCIEGAGSSADILVNPGNLGITSSTVNAAAVEGNHSGSGDVELRMTAGSIVTTETAGHGLYAQHAGATGGGAIVIGMSGGSVETRGSNAYALRGRRASGTGNVRIDVTGGSLSRTGGTGGVVLGAHGGTGNVTINMSGGATLEATGAGVRGLSGSHSGTGDLTVSLTGGSVVTTSNGVGATRSNAATAGNAAVTVSHASSVVRTTGNNGHGLAASNSGSGDATVTMRDGLVETTGGGSRGISAYSSYTGMNPGTVSVVMEGGTVRTSGGTYVNVLHAHGIYAESNSGHTAVSVRMTGGAVETAGASAHGIVVFKAGPAGAGSIEMTGGSVTTAGDGAHGAYVYMYSTGASTEGLSIDAAGAVSAEGLNARGLLGVHTVLGSATVRTRAAAEVAAPFAVGMEGRLTNDASAAGRILVTHAGAVEARNAGILAWARRSSGHTMGAGATTADDAARTAPMIHVRSSGDVTVGASVTDAFIRGRIAGADETLSTGEQAVLSAITAGDSDALTTALAALPDDDYDADWKAEAQDLLRKRAAAPTGDGPAAQRAAEEILGLSRAGVRAAALSHTAIADHVRAGDALSDEERAALEAVLTKGAAGSELETALTALTGATYTTAWKDTVRQHAATYNAGDVQVDVTGGSIDAEGNGVEALYAVPHDSNGAIAVTVAEGARVTGGANGLYVRGAGVTSDVRNQTVTVNGAAMGGTGAGVHMFGGGAVTVRAGGEVGAASGVAILGDGGGALTAIVSGTVTGDIRVDGDGSLTANVMSGGVVTGTLHDPQTPYTVGNGASIGRLLYAGGATVTVAGGGKLTGVEGTAVESTAGPLSVTVNDEGRVEGDLESGGTLTANVMSGGVVTGTLHDPQTPYTVGNGASIGRLLYAGGATVTVSGGGKLTGVEGTAVESTAGPLSVTVNDEGRVEGDLESGGTLTANVMSGGVVTGTLHDPQTPYTVGNGASIGRLLYAGGATVTVSGGGKLTGVEGAAVESTAGPLSVTVNDEGRVEGDLESGGTLTANVMSGGVVTGTLHDPQTPYTVGNGASIGRLLYAGGATVTVSGGGKLTGVEGTAVESTAGPLSVTVNDEGRVEGDLESGGTLTANVMSGGVVTGTLHDPQTPYTVGNGASIGRLLYAGGATVTVAASGALTGVEVEGRREALRSEAGDLDLRVAGSVTGDVRAEGDGDLAATISGTLTGDILGLGAGEHVVTVSNGGTVTGTVHLAASTVGVDGTAGRVLFDNGGTVTVGGAGHITGIAVEDRTEAIRNEAGGLVVSVADGGRITGDVIDQGTRPARVTTGPGSRVEGSIDVAAAGSELRVDGTVEGRVRYRRGGMVTVGPDGRIEGRVSSDRGEIVAVAERKPGETEVAAWRRAFPGGVVEGEGPPLLPPVVEPLPQGGVTVRDPASPLTVTDHSIGRLLYSNGGAVTVAASGRLTGVEVEGRSEAIRSEAGDLVVTVARGGEVGGDVRALGDGDLVATISGRVAGDVLGSGAGEHTVTVGEGGSVKGTLRFDGGVNRVKVHEGGRIESREGRRGRAISNEEGGTLEVVVRAAGEEAAFDALNRIEGSLYDHRGLPEVRLQRAGEEARLVGRFATRTALADGAHDVGLSPVSGPGREGEYEFKREHAPRARVYEALPSVVLGLNGVRGYGERMSAPRSAKGGWARVEGFRGKWKADASASQKESGVGLKYRHRRHGIEVGWAVALGEEARFGASLHHRRGTAKVTEGGDVELYGTGVGASGTWMRDEFYVDAQAAMTGYEADLTSSRRGVLRKDLSGHGHALGVEAGRRLALEGLPAGVVLTSRAGLVHSRVSMGAFSDSVGSRVSVDDARSLRGRAGVDVEAKREGSPQSRMFASVEVEHEFSTDRKVRVSGTEETELRSEAEATWLRLGLNGVYAWEEGRYTVQGGMSYATSGGSHELGGGLSLNLRF